MSLEKRNVLSWASLPTHLPFWETITFYLLLDKFSPLFGFLRGVIFVIVCLYWVAALCLKFTEKQIKVIITE